jgi:hypothetical protein
VEAANMILSCDSALAEGVFEVVKPRTPPTMIPEVFRIAPIIAPGA